MVHLLIHRNLLYSESSSWLRWWNTEEMNQQGTFQRICKKLLRDYGTCIVRNIIRRLKNWCIMCHTCTTWKEIITIVIDFSRSGCPARNQPRCTADTSALLYERATKVKSTRVCRMCTLLVISKSLKATSEPLSVLQFFVITNLEWSTPP